MIPAPLFNRTRSAWPLILLAVVVLIAYAPAWAQGRVYFELDTIKQNAPFAAFVAEEIDSGIFPLWNPYLFTGYPQFADGQAGVLFPLHLPFFLSGAVEALLVWGPPLRSLVAALAAYAFARTLKISPLGSTLAGLSYGLGSFAVAQQHHFNIANAAPILPLVLVTWERAFTASTARFRLAWLGLAALTLSTVLLAIQPQLVLITGFGIAAYVITSIAVGRWRSSSDIHATSRTVVWAVGGLFATVALATGLAAVQVAPLLELIGESERANVLDPTEISRFSVPPLGATQLIFPGVFGSQSSYWFMWNAWETSFYAGVVPLVLAMIALTRPTRTIIVLAVVGVAAALIAQGADGPTPVFDAVRRIPGFDRSRAPGRFVMIAILMIGPLAGCGLDQLRRTVRPRLGIFITVLLVSAVATLAVVHAWVPAGSESLQLASQWLLAHQELSRIPVDTSRTDLLLESTNPLRLINTVPVVAGILFLTTVVAAAPWPALRPWLAPTAIILTTVELVLFSATFHPSMPVSDLLLQAGSRPELTAPGTYPRVFVSEGIYRGSNRFLLTRTAEATGYAPLVPTRTKQLIDAWHDDPQHIAHLLGVETVAYLDDGIRGFGSHFVEGETVTFSLNRPALVIDTWSSEMDRTISLPEVGEIGAAHLVLSMSGGVDAAQGESVGVVTWLVDNTPLSSQPLTAGVDVSERTAFGPLKPRNPSHQLADIAASVGAGRISVYTLARFPYEGQETPNRLEFQVTRPGAAVTIHGISLIDRIGDPHRFWVPLLTQIEDFEPLLLGKFTPQSRLSLHQRIRLVGNVEDALREVIRVGANLAPRTIIEAGPWGPSLDPELLAKAPPNPQTLTHARLLSESSNELVIETESAVPSMLVVRDAFYPGWKATVDGDAAPVLPADVASRAIPVPPGIHQVVLRFEPGSFKVGIVISVASCILFTAFLLTIWHWPQMSGRAKQLYRWHKDRP